MENKEWWNTSQNKKETEMAELSLLEEHAKDSKSLEPFQFSPNYYVERNCQTNLELATHLYHGTTEEHLEDIKKNGLKPSCKTGINNFPHITKTNSVYLTTDKHTAYLVSRMNWKQKGIIISIPKANIPLDKLKLDENLESECNSFRLEESISSDSFSNIEEIS